MDNTFIIERTLKAPADKVWRAITDRDEMAKWYFDLDAFKPEKGFKFSFKGGPPDKEYIHLCEVTEVVKGSKITYSWKYQGYEGISYVTFELFGQGEQTRIKLTHAGLESFPANEPDLARKNFEAGWTDIIGKLLPEYLEKN
jgi:uncharacterized protein YndB with AHSA1/START domain